MILYVGSYRIYHNMGDLSELFSLSIYPRADKYAVKKTVSLTRIISEYRYFLIVELAKNELYRFLSIYGQNHYNQHSTHEISFYNCPEIHCGWPYAYITI